MMMMALTQTETERLTAALKSFGWDCTPDFWRRYHTDAWVYNLANAVALLHTVDDDEFAEQIAMGVHTGLRKGSEAPSSASLWRAISESSDSAWSDAAEYCVSGLKAMGYRLMRDADRS
jgi:hypothetical protein